MRKLAVFDIDGTLTDTSAVDADCFVSAMSRALDLPDVNPDWGVYSDCTDAIIIAEVFGDRCGRRPTTGEQARFVDEFVRLLGLSYQAEPARFEPIAGAPEFIEELKAAGEWEIAIATGGWQRSARLKLTLAGIEAEALPFASSDDAATRDLIVKTAIRRALSTHCLASFDRIVALGDAPWDVRAAARLELPFIGIASGERADRLRSLGASTILEDYRDLEKAISCLDRATRPHG